MSGSFLIGAMTSVLLMSSCTAGPDQESAESTSQAPRPGTATIAVTGVSPIPTTGATESVSGPSSTPTTQPGVLTGPGIDDTTITLGSLVDPEADRGFQQGLALWAGSINNSGGICGRGIQISTGTSADLAQSYRDLGASVLGFATSAATQAQADTLSELMTADQMPALTFGGASTDLRQVSPVIIGPTDDILAIDSLDYLITTGTVATGDSIGVLLDTSRVAQDALKGLRWRADLEGIELQTTTDPLTAAADFAVLPAAFALVEPSVAAGLAHELPLTTVVLTTESGYRADLVSPADARHLRVVLATPAYGSDHPGAVAVAAAFSAAGMIDPGPLLFAGYAVGATWQRLLAQACDQGNLTREAMIAGLSTIGPASVDGMFGGSDPGQVVGSYLPASRSASIAQADPAAPTGLTPLTGLFTAEGINDYVP